MVLGLIGLITWCIPLFGVPVAICGMVFSVKGISSPNRGRAVAGLTLSIISAVLTLINAAIGAYMGAHGQMWYQQHH